LALSGDIFEIFGVRLVEQPAPHRVTHFRRGDAFCVGNTKSHRELSVNFSKRRLNLQQMHGDPLLAFPLIEPGTRTAQATGQAAAA
jgi:hypothetical protein